MLLSNVDFVDFFGFNVLYGPSNSIGFDIVGDFAHFFPGFDFFTVFHIGEIEILFR